MKVSEIDYKRAQTKLLLVIYFTLLGSAKGTLDCLQANTQFLPKAVAFAVHTGYVLYPLIFLSAILLRSWIDEARRALIILFVVDLVVTIPALPKVSPNYFFMFMFVVVPIRVYFILILMDFKTINIIHHKGDISSINTTILNKGEGLQAPSQLKSTAKKSTTSVRFNDSGEILVSCSQRHEFSASRLYAGVIRKCPDCGEKVSIPQVD